jgi:hypothetical protein
MRQAFAQRSYFTCIAEHIGAPLRERCDDIMHEPLPERWVDLMNYLNAQEKERREAQATVAGRQSLTH